MYITFYSTCQGEAICETLKKSLGDEHIYNVIRNYQFILEQCALPINILEKTDIFIYQEIGPSNGVYSTCNNIENNIVSYLPKICKKIIIPYVHASWLWGVICALERDTTTDSDNIEDRMETNNVYSNTQIIYELKKTHSLHEILYMYDNFKIDFNFKDRMQKEMDILKNKEVTTDIKVCDFIQQNYTSINLFTTNNHPTGTLIIHMVKQILTILDININYTFNYDVDILPGKTPHSSYEIKYHEFKFDVFVDDNIIKKYITNIYNQTC